MKVVVVTDCAFGVPFFDQDDALALWFLLKKTKSTVLGIITTHGNLPEFLVFPATVRLIKILESKTPIIRQKKGSSFLVDQVKKFPGEIVVLSLGALTVISEAIRSEPKLPRLWRRLVVMGGTGGIKPVGWPIIREELNFKKDKKATEYVLKKGRPVLVTLKETRKHSWGLKEVSILPKDLQKHLKFWFWVNRIIGKRGFNPHDLVAAEAAVTKG